MTAPVYAVIGSSGPISASNLTRLKNAGVSRIVLQAYWDRLQPNGAGAVDSANMAAFNSQFDAVTAAGMDVIIEHAIHFPPNWVKNSVEPFTDQNGTVFTGQNPGADVRNWIWTATGRTAVHQFITAFTAGLGSSRVAAVDRIKLGGSIYGELQYNINGSSFNGFGPSMQTGAGLAGDVVVCPVPGYKPFSGNDSKDVAWINWYIDGMIRWALFFVQTMKDAGYTCPLHLMCPSSGLRTNQVRTDSDYRYQISQGTDYTRMVGAIKRDPQAQIWCTWINGPNGSVNPAADNQQGAWAALWADAAVRGKSEHIWGENTGGEGDTSPNASGSGMSMQQTFANALAKGTPAQGTPYVTGTSSLGDVDWTPYSGMMWLNAESLFAGGGNADVNYFAQQISARNAQG
jgi:hypothetical protein